MQEKGISVAEATKKLEYYCAYQDRCYKEVVTKLKSLGMYDDAINHIIDHLTKEKFLDETRYAISFTTGKHRNKYWGKKRIELELKMRNISTYNINKALKEIEKEYNNTFFSLAEKKWDTIKDDQFDKKKQKWTSYMLRKGYEYSLINEYLNDMVK